MKAVLAHSFGPPSVLNIEDVPDPIAGPGEVLIEVFAASVIFMDTRVRAGKSAWWRPELPYIPGNGVGGIIRDVAAGVDRQLIGRRVIAPIASGGYAELAVAGADDCVPIPDGFESLIAIALIADGRTAVRLTRAARPAIGEWVLVEAAGGGLGSLLVQLARNTGARVIGAASTVEKRELAVKLGAALAIDYMDPDWAQQIRDIIDGNGLDLVFDGVGGEIGATAFNLVRDGGRFVVHGSASGSPTAPDAHVVQDRHLDFFGPDAGSETPANRLIQLALDEATRGRLEPSIQQTLPLEDAARAHAAIENRSVTGRIVLVPHERRT
jgi:NADPH2:quinone reductase